MTDNVVMGLVAVICVEELHIYRLIQVNLKRQGWIVFRASNGLEAVEHVRHEGASFLIFDDNGLRPSTQAQIAAQIQEDPGDDRVKIINLNVKSPQPPTIFGNPKGPLPPAVAVRPHDWIKNALRR